MLSDRGEILEVSDSAAELLAHPLTWLQGRLLTDLAVDKAESIDAALWTTEPARLRLRSGNGLILDLVLAVRLHRGPHKRLMELIVQGASRPVGPDAEEPALALFRALSDEVSIGLALCRMPDGAFVEVNQALLNLLGTREADLIGKTSKDIDLWVDPAQRLHLQRDIYEGRTIRNYPTQIRAREGQIKDVLLSLKTILLAGQRHLLAAFQVASSSALAQSALALSEARLVRVLTGSSLGAWEWNLATQDAYYCCHWSLILGCEHDPPEPHTSAFRERIHPDDSARFELALERHLLEKSRLDSRLRMRTGSGAHRWMRARAQAQRNDEGRPTRLSGTIEDIHDSYVAALNRQRIEERLALATSAAKVGTWEVFKNGTAIWDPQTYKAFGHDPSTHLLPEQIYPTALSASEFERLKAWFFDVLQSSESRSLEFEIRTPAGDVRWMAVQGKAIHNESGEPTSLLGVIWDITDQRRAHNVLLKQQRKLSELAHELLEQERRTTRRLALTLHDHLGQTLTALRLSFEATMGNASSTIDAEQAHRIDSLLEQATALVHDVIQDLRPPLLDDFGLVAALENELANPTLSKGKVDLLLVPGKLVSELRWPSDVEYACFMIAREAVSNALEHARPSTVHVSLTSHGRGLSMDVVDDGIGFATQGLGGRPGNLGLVGMKERALAIGARLEFESRIDAGTRVSLKWEPAT